MQLNNIIIYRLSSANCTRLWFSFSDKYPIMSLLTQTCCLQTVWSWIDSRYMLLGVVSVLSTLFLSLLSVTKWKQISVKYYSCGLGVQMRRRCLWVWGRERTINLNLNSNSCSSLVSLKQGFSRGRQDILYGTLQIVRLGTDEAHTRQFLRM